MKFTKILTTGVAASLLSLAAAAATVEIAGVKVEDSAILNGVKVGLNGAGIFYKGPFKVYVGELYVGKKVSSQEELSAATGPKRVKMTFVREVESALIGKLMTRGIEDNAPKADMSKLIPGLIRMGDIFAANKTFVVGDVITLDWIPGTGLIVTGKNQIQGEPFKEPEFFKAITSIWLGPQPSYFKLKDEMLGLK